MVKASSENWKPPGKIFSDLKLRGFGAHRKTFEYAE